MILSDEWVANKRAHNGWTGMSIEYLMQLSTDHMEGVTVTTTSGTDNVRCQLKVQGRIIEDSIAIDWHPTTDYTYTNRAMDLRARMLAKLEEMQRAGQIVGPAGKWRKYGRRAPR